MRECDSRLAGGLGDDNDFVRLYDNVTSDFFREYWFWIRAGDSFDVIVLVLVIISIIVVIFITIITIIFIIAKSQASSGGCSTRYGGRGREPA